MPDLSEDLSLELRLRFLETLTRTPSTSPSSLSLSRRASLVQYQLNQLLETGGAGDSIRRFVHGCTSLLLSLHGLELMLLFPNRRRERTPVEARSSLAVVGGIVGWS